MDNKITTAAMGAEYWQELESESEATRKCLARIPESLFSYKPHEKSMKMGDLALIVAEIPNWISQTIKDSVIDLATYKPAQPKTTADLVNNFEKNLKEAKNVLQNTSNEALAKTFNLKSGERVLMSASKKDTVRSSINHLVHHRGQLTVYMRLNNIPVPKIYGPSADEKEF